MNTRILALIFLTSTVSVQADKPPEVSRKFEDLKPLMATISKAEKVILHEGLPHQSNEGGLMEAEKKAKKTITILDWPFYAETLVVKVGDAKKLAEMLADDKSFRKTAGGKKCGGFHPDYAIEWRVGKDTYYALLCFGCGEMKLYGPDKAVYVDFGGEARTAIGELLKPYRKNRPEPKVDDRP